jgi:hypothetical protein
MGGVDLRAWLRGLVPGTRGERVAIYGLFAILLAGALVRVAFFLAWRPAFMGFPDEISYIRIADGALFADGLRVDGYPIFLRFVHSISPRMSFTILVQHLLGLASAVFVFLTVRRAAGPPWLGLFAAAVVALNGAQMFLEHSILTETLFIFLTSVALYAVVRAYSGAFSPAWAGASGLLLAAATLVRPVALPLIAVFALWLLFALPRGWRTRLAATAACLVAAGALLGVYMGFQKARNGYLGLAPAGVWNLYGRVAPFADCSKFTPPKGTRVLCESTSPSYREHHVNVDSYTFSADVSPAVRAFGGPFASSQANNRKLSAFVRAVILHQPFTYLKVVAQGMVGYVHPGVAGWEHGNQYKQFFQGTLFDPQISEDARQWVLPYYNGNRAYYSNPAWLSRIKAYESHSRLKGPFMAIALLLTLGAPFAPRGRPRAMGALLFAVAWVSLITPVATHWWDARFTVPVLGPVVAAASLGGWVLVRALAPRLRGQHPFVRRRQAVGGGSG